LDDPEMDQEEMGMELAQGQADVENIYASHKISEKEER
jgi:hypothetical protein